MSALTPPKFEHGKVVSLFAIVFYLLLVFGGLWLLYSLRYLFGPLLIALTIALTLAPLTDRMEAHGWRRDTAIMVIYASFLAVCVGFLLIMVPVISKQLHEIAALVMVPSKSVQADAEHITEDIMRPWMQRRHVPSDVQAPLLESVSGVHRHIGEYLNQIGTALPVVAGNIVLAIFIIVAAYYLLSDYHKIVGKMLLFVKPESQLNALRITNEVVAVFGNYVRGVVVVMLMDIVVIYITLRALGIDHAETIAFVSGVLYAVPYIGAAISTVLIGVVAFADHHNGLAFALLTTAIMIVIHQIIFNMIVAPRVIGKHVGLHPLWAITAMMVGYTVMGVGGTVLAVPIAGAIQVVLVHFLPKLKDEEVARMSEEYSQRLNSRSIKQIVSENVDSAPAGAPPPLAEAKVPPAPASVGGLPPTT